LSKSSVPSAYIRLPTVRNQQVIGSSLIAGSNLRFTLANIRVSSGWQAKQRRLSA
jgi:hypothetical protein